METLPDLKRRYSMTRKATAVAPIGCEEDSKEPDAFTEGDKEELQALKFRATRRTVMARYISKCDEQEADKDAIRKALQRLNDTVDSCKELIMFNNPKVTSPASKVH
uniref:Uncharacterized protein n=1 Tax=Mucochytrium quahogii TaxID=96639 RepID=A0A7S2WAT0_9STRA|mmetsp:Transcript_18284/g.39685  ORF Transcript_18284/g.39685 Transcript_18284/m.39685 type:complete len:107 (+) Transcript_18284:1-321(+)